MTDEARILEIEKIGYAAIESGDAALLEELLAPDFHATTADGLTLSRDEWIERVTAAARHGIRLRPGAATVTISSNLAIVHREVRVEVAAEATEPAARIGYVTAYERREGRWVVALNSARKI
jgi:hypothetical protein